MPSFELGFSASVFTAICLVLAACIIAVLAYRRTLPPISPRLRLLLILLRATSLALLLLLLVEPVLRLTHVLREKPTIAVLIDNSASMHLHDATVDRAETLRRVLQEFSGAVTSDVQYYTFGSRVSRPSSHQPDSLSLDEETTDIAQALRQAKRDAESHSVRAAVLLTDGVYTAGTNPLYEGDTMPIYAVGIGDSTEQRDLLVSSLSANELAYEGSPTPVDLRIKSSGYGGERVTVQLRDGAKEMARGAVILQPGTREYALTLYLTPQGAGVHRYTAAVSTLPGEVTTENNRRGFSMRVLKSKLSVVLLAGLPGPDVAVVRQTFSEDPNLRAVVFVQRQDGGFYGPAPTQGQMDSADCLATINFPTSATRENVLSLVARTINDRHVPLLFVAGRELDLSRLNSLTLPCTPGPVDKSEQELFFEPSASQKNHPLLLLDSAGGSSGWGLLPPVFRSGTMFRATPDAAVLGTSRTHGVTLADPMMVAGSRDGRKTLALLGYGFWRWRLMAQGRPETEHLFSSFLSTAIRWLTTREDTRRIRVHPVRPAFSRLEPVGFEGEVYDAAARPLTNATIRVTFQRQGSPIVLDLASAGNGRYTGEAAPPPEGEYVYHASVEVQGTRVGADSGRFVVGGLDVEGLETRMAAGALRELAARSGGVFFTANDIAALGDSLKRQPRLQPVEHRSADTFELRQWTAVLLFVMGLLAVEWFIRKRNGML